MMETGKLYLVATPIGNLGDMSPRAVETLKSVGLIAAEDTRNSIKLLNHFNIKVPITSYHEYNKIEKAHELISRMQEGISIALITDAGMPAISDPGEDLVRLCYESGIEVTVVPGPSAVVSAAALSGLSSRRFVFEGFLPADKKEKEEALERLRNETRTIILYEAPHRLMKTLAALEQVLGGDRDISLVKELTKLHERVIRTTISEAQKMEEPKGEYVIVIEGRDPQELIEKERSEWDKLSVKEHVALYEARGMSRKDAMKQAAADRGVGKREIYRECIEEDDE